MDIGITRQDTVVIVIPKGRIDGATAKEFEDKLLSVVRDEKKIVVDFSDIDYISSAGLRVILLAAKSAKSKGHGLALCSMKAPIHQVFDISGFAKLLNIAGSRAQALAAV